MCNIGNFFRRLYFFLLCFYLCSILCFGQNNGENIIQLETEYCMPRKEIVAIGAPLYFYIPAMVSVYRCSGVVGEFSPAFKICVKNTSDILQLEVKDSFYTDERSSYSLENHTSCTGQCVRDSSACSDTQIWDSKNCKCVCDPTVKFTCPKQYMTYDPNLCQCVCSRTCLEKQIKNETECSCTCKPKFYHRCNDIDQLLVENDCSCIEPKAQSGIDPCEHVSTKWIVLTVILSFLVLFILAVNCILCVKKGCINEITQFCIPQDHRGEENRPMNKNGHKNVYTETVHV